MPRALSAAGVVVDPRLRLRSRGPKGAGLFVTAPTPAGATLISVPSQAILTGELAQRVLGCPELAPETALCALLAEARRDAEGGRQDALGLREYLLKLPTRFTSL